MVVKTTCTPHELFQCLPLSSELTACSGVHGPPVSCRKYDERGLRVIGKHLHVVLKGGLLRL